MFSSILAFFVLCFSQKKRHINVLTYIELERTLKKIPPEIVFRYSGKTIKQEVGENRE